MPRIINIEIMRLRPTKKTAIVMAFLALIIGCLVTSLPGAQAQYATAEQDRHVFTFADDLDVGVDVTEKQWMINFGEEGMEVEAGKVAVKDPVITNTKNDCYMRACVRIVDRNGNPLDQDAQASQVKTILRSIWYDPSEDADGTSSEAIINVNKKYSNYDLYTFEEEGTAMQFCNTNKFEQPVYNENMKAYTMNYKGVFKAGAKVTLFNRIVIPSDTDKLDIQILGDYYVVVWCQAIQTYGFSDADTAISKISDAYVPTEVPEKYKTTGRA